MSAHFEPRAIAARFAITLSPRYLRFLADERTTLGRRFAVVPSYQSAIPVAFDGDALESFFHDAWPEDNPGYAHPYASEVELAGTGWVPLATLGEEAQFLVVRAGTEPCPVAMWEHETEDFTPCAASLDAFLASLGTTKKAAKVPKPPKGPDLRKVRTLVDKLDTLVDKPASAKRTKELEAGLATLEPMLVAMPHTKTLDRDDDAPLVGLAHLTRGNVLRALGRFEEALAALERAEIDGTPQNIAPQTVAELLLHDLDRPERVIELCTAFVETRPVMRRVLALALFRLGRIDEAAAQLALVVERGSAKNPLFPDRDPVTEAPKVRARLAVTIQEYANRRGLDASALLARLG